jgi:lysozyme
MTQQQDSARATRPTGKGVGAGLTLGSAVLLAFLTLWESGSTRVLTVYADQLAGGIPTVCNGLTRHVTKTPIIVGEKWTTEKCEREEKLALEIHVQRPLLRCFQRTPPQSVFDAASSHAWNFGVGKTCGSAAMRAWNAGQWHLGCQRIYVNDKGAPAWSYAGGKFYRGLQNRRKAEYRMCVKDLVP